MAQTIPNCIIVRIAAPIAEPPPCNATTINYPSETALNSCAETFRMSLKLIALVIATFCWMMVFFAVQTRAGSVLEQIPANPSFSYSTFSRRYPVQLHGVVQPVVTYQNHGQEADAGLAYNLVKSRGLRNLESQFDGHFTF
ncbi:hypothetical protein pipiens_014735 [Culex pipiens pipiens]|uniref:Uncharacterized protein n=1 Tax=Culex pipiens pipiens TaxID=38569 RepID=A0ABD1CT97_CULPP